MKGFKLSIILYLSLVFLSGVLVGVLGHRFYTAQTVKAKTTQKDAERQYVEEMRTRLKLDNAQLQQLTQILDTTHTRYQELRKKYRPEVKAIQEAQVEKIRSMLSDPQRLEYEKMRQERQKAK